MKTVQYIRYKVGSLLITHLKDLHVLGAHELFYYCENKYINQILYYEIRLRNLDFMKMHADECHVDF